MHMRTNVSNPIYAIEVQEVIQKLRDHGYGELVDCLLDHASDCYTKKDRLNKSGTIRKLGWKSKKLEDALKQMREILGPEFGFDED